MRFNNPLAIAMGNLGLLKDDLAPAYATAGPFDGN